MSWPKRLSVDKRIVLLLSASTYENFPRALRELVSNAHDADATSVSIDIDTKKKQIVVEDNGSGMTPDEFDFFLRIAGEPRSPSRNTELSRTRIGQFGIGFLAMFPFCRSMEIESTVAGSSVVFVAQIEASHFFLTTKSEGSEDVTDSDVNGSEREDHELRAAHYTKITMIGTNVLIDRYLRDNSADFKNIKEKSVRRYSGIERLRWELQDILPVPYKENSLISEYIEPRSLDFNVYLNETKLIANEFITEVLAHSDGYGKVGEIVFSWVIGTAWKAIHPNEARGLRVRLHRVGVGPRQFFDLGIAGRTFSRLHWLSGEVNVVSGLDEAITLDRDSFTQTQDFDELRTFLQSKIRAQAYFIEDVDTAKRKIKAQIDGTHRASVASIEQVIESETTKLRNRGFKVVEKKNTQSNTSPVEIDTTTKTVTINTHVQVNKETIQIDNVIYEVKYDKWENGQFPNSVYRFSDNNVVTLNQNFRFFNGTHKDVFKRVFLALAFADINSDSKEQFLIKLNSGLTGLFEVNNK